MRQPRLVDDLHRPPIGSEPDRAISLAADVHGAPAPRSLPGFPSPHAGGMSSTWWGGDRGGGSPDKKCSAIPPSPALPHKGGGSTARTGGGNPRRIGSAVGRSSSSLRTLLIQ